MGQYYNAMIQINGKNDVFNHYVDGEYMMAKLMEHSWWENAFVLAVASKLWRTKGRLAWVGDYADEEDANWKDEFKAAHGGDEASKVLTYNGFRLEGKIFINHDKKIFIDLDKYKEKLKDFEWIINPVSLLTAVGNGKGGGDFYKSGRGYELVGTWTWDIVEITDEEIYNWKYNNQTQKYDKFLKKEFEDYIDVTDEYLFAE